VNASRANRSVTVIRRVNWPKDLETVRRLFQDYRRWIADHRDTRRSAAARVRTGLGEIDDLISELPGAYGPPRGEVVLARVGTVVVACLALREIEPKIGDIKRVYVREDHRGPVFGPRLTRALLKRARELGYERVRVDTLPTMAAAIEFYPAMGFEPIDPYWSHPVAGARFFEYVIRSSRPVRRRKVRARSKRRGD
jgi:ribosomal protein S18 acetylase RimI-like enzyme